MNTIAKSISMFLLSLVIMALLITTALAFMLGPAHPLPWALLATLIIIPILHEKIISRQMIKWDNSMSIGIELIDSDHKTLINLINQLQRATQYRVDKNRINKIITKLVSYTKYHFEREEYLMEKNHYPDYETHKKLHEDMIKKITTCAEKYKSNPDQSINDALAFLKGWLIEHIKGSDREYIPYLKDTDLTDHKHRV